MPDEPLFNLTTEVLVWERSSGKFSAMNCDKLPLGARRLPCNRRAFSLVELLVVVSISLALAALLFTALPRAMEATQRTQCLSLLKKMSAAANLYAADKGCYPTSIYAEGNPVNNRPYWPQYLTDYMDVTNTAAVRNTLYRCPKPGPDGLPEYQIYNMWMGFRDDDVAQQKYIRISPLAVPQPSKTSLFTCGFNRQPNETGRHYHYRTGRGSGTASVNRTKFSGGANWAFVDGHAKWLSEAEVIDLCGTNGQAIPFIKPF